MAPNADLEALIANAIMVVMRRRKRSAAPFDALAAAKNVLIELHVEGYEVVPPNGSLAAPEALEAEGPDRAGMAHDDPGFS